MTRNVIGKNEKCFLFFWVLGNYNAGFLDPKTYAFSTTPSVAGTVDASSIPQPTLKLQGGVTWSVIIGRLGVGIAHVTLRPGWLFYFSS